MNISSKKSAILLIHCKDQPGIVVSITDFIFNSGGNILSLDQHVDSEHQKFFMRVEWDLKNFSIVSDSIGIEFEKGVASGFGMQWQLHFSSD
jgi:formyltetrahydrofolate deformylase